MKEIPLTQGKVAIVDDEDFEWLSQCFNPVTLTGQPDNNESDRSEF